MKYILIILFIIPLIAFTQQNYIYQYQDYNSGKGNMKMELNNQNFQYENKTPYAQKSSNGNPLNLGFGFSNSMYDENMSGAYDVVQTDSFYYIAGRTRIGAGSLTNNELMFSMKLDLQGNVVWKRMDSLLDANHWDLYYGHALTQLDNGNFVQVAMYAEYDTIKLAVNYFPLLTKFDESGNLISKFVMNYDSISNWVDSTTFTPYGGIFTKNDENIVSFGILTSKTWVWRTDYSHYLPDSLCMGMIELDSSYNVVNFKTYLIPEFGKDVIVYNGEKTRDNGFLVTLYSYSNHQDFIIKIDSNLNYEWHYMAGDSIISNWNPIKAIESNAGGYLFVREFPVDKFDNQGEKKIAYGKLNKQGELLWEKKCDLYTDTAQPWNGIYRMPMGIIEQDNGDILFSTRINLTNGAGLVRTDSLGNIKWYRWILGMYGDVGNQNNAGGMFLFNMRKPIGEGALLVGHAGFGKAQLIRTDSMGCTMPNCLDTMLHIGIEEFEIMQKQQLIVYPNPAQEQVQFAINIQGEKIDAFEIYDNSGRLIAQQKSDNYLVSFSIVDLPQGMYIVKILSNNQKQFVGRFVKD